jgi:hypothetical protein
MATDATLTKLQKNAVLEAIQKFQFDPAEFDWAEVVSEEWAATSKFHYMASNLVHRGTGYYITFGGVSQICSPGHGRKVESERHSNIWENQMRRLEEWLYRLRKEVDAPDLWAAVGKERELSEAASSHLENKPFTVAEKSEIAAKLGELKHYLLSGQQFQIAQTKYIDEQFRYLRESSERLGRKDWLNIAFSTLINLAVTLALPPERATGLLQLAGSLLKSLWHEVHGLLASS